MESTLQNWDGNLLIEALMRLRGIKKPSVLVHHSLKMGLIDNQHLVQAFFTHRPNPTL
jgi:hypothetical protein